MCIRASANIPKETSETFKVRVKKLFTVIMTPALLLTWVSGLSMTHYLGFDFWLILKLFFVALLTIYHFLCRKFLKDFANDNNKIKSKIFRITNEIPAVFLIAIIILVVFKPF